VAMLSGSGMTSYTATGPFNGSTTYYFRVHAYAYTGGNSAYATASATTPAFPNQAALSAATAQSDTAVALSWSDVAGETGFRVERSADNGSTWTAAGTVSTGVTSFTDAGLNEAVSYTYRVVATNAAGSSAPSATRTAATLPSAPTGLAAMAVSPMQVNLTWTDHSSAAYYYYVEQSADGVTWTQVGSVYGTTANSYTATGPFNGATTYSFRVRAYAGTGGYSAYSPVAAATTPGFPSRPTLSAATPQSDTAITLSWTDTAGEAGFRVERYVASAGTWTAIGLVPAGVTTYTDAGLREGNSFTYRVVATNAVGDSAPSASLGATAPTSAPTGLSANAIAWDRIDLSWTDHSALATTYYVEQSTDGTTWMQIGYVPDPGATSFSATGPFAPSTTYYFRIHAYSFAGGNSAYATVSVVTPTYPGQPTLTSATAQSDAAITLGWSDVSGETGFRIERLVGGAWTAVGAVGAGVTSFTDTGLHEATSYSYRLFATNAVGDSVPSATRSIVTMTSAPTGLTANAIAWNQINLSWIDHSSTASSYYVEESSDGTTWTQIATLYGSTATSYTATGRFNSSTTYYFRVRAYAYSGGYSNYASTSTVTPAFPDAPAGVHAAVASNCSINVLWDEVANEAGFRVERSTNGGAWSVAGSTGAGVTSFTDAGLQAGIPYSYRVIATNAAGDSAYSSTVSLTIIDPTANNDSYIAIHGRTLTISATNGVLVNDTDAYGKPLSAAIVVAAGHGTVTLQPDGSFTYTPAAGFVGTDTFTYQDNDGPLSGNVATVTIDVTDPHAPVAVNEAYTIPHDTTLVASGSPAGVLANDSDTDGDALTAVLIAGPQNGTLTLNPDGTFAYIPNPGFYGEDNFTYQASDGALTSAAKTDTITVTPTGGSAPLDPTPLFSDNFSGDTLDPSWQPVGGTWSIASGTLSQTSTAPGGTNELVLSDQVLPNDLQVTAKVRADSWSGDSTAWAGVALDADPTTGGGYALVFHGADAVQFLDGSSTWGNFYPFTWTRGTWYDFKLEAVGSSLYGKVWADGTTEPTAWMFQQSGWTDQSGGAPALVSGPGSNSTASFQDFALCYAPDDPADFAPTPVIASPATASETDVTGNSTELSVVATVDGDPSNLTYTWSIESMPEGAFAPQLSDNDSATASDVTATFTSAGDYTFLVTVDNDGSHATSEVAVTLEQTATSITVSPPFAAIHRKDRRQFTATVEDQFGHPMDPEPSVTWSVASGPGTIDQDGLYTAPDSGTGEAIVEIQSGSASATATVEVTDQNIINFDDLPAGTIVTDQFPIAQFSGDPAYPNQVIASTDASTPNSIGAPTPQADGGQPNGNPYIHPLYVDFTIPVNDLHFVQMRDDAAGGTTIAQVRVFERGSLSATVPIYSTGGVFTPGDVDLSAYQDVTRIEIVNVTDPAGLLYDDFRFTPYSVQLTPYRTGDFQGQVVSDDVKQSGDPSKYVVLVDDYYTKPDGTPALESDTADTPDGSGSGEKAPEDSRGWAERPIRTRRREFALPSE